MPFHAFGQPNLKAVFVAILAMKGLGYLFYAPRTLGPSWRKAWKLKPGQVSAHDPVNFSFAILQSALAAMTMDFFMRHLGWTSPWGGVRLALYLWLGFSLGTLATHYRFARVPPRAAVIDSLFELAQLLAAGLILGAWR